MTPRAISARPSWAEMQAWDRQLKLSTMSKDGLVDVARERGIPGVSDLPLREVRDVLERDLFGEQPPSPPPPGFAKTRLEQLEEN
jgi:hypothetical protein